MFFIVLACGLLLSISGVSSEPPATVNSVSATSSTHAPNAPRYSDWQQSDDANQRVGSFLLVKKPESEIIYNALNERWRKVLAGSVNEQSLLNFAESGVRNKLVSNTAPLDFRQWLLNRREHAVNQLTEGTIDYLTQYGVGQAETNAGALSFVRNINWDYRSGLGKRKWETGLSALGALRELPEEAVVWQLRGYAAEESSAGANAGFIYRRAVIDTLLGANVFLDYEKHGTYDESFWRGSFGLEFRSAHMDIYANRYLAITDPVPDGDESIYSKDGFDLEIAIKPLPELNISGGVTYYKWEGEFGDADDRGFLYNLRLRPFSNFLKNIEIETQLDSPINGDVSWGGIISYRYKLGAPLESNLSAKPLTFDPRAHFFDPVRREYNQRIARSGGANAKGQSMVFGNASPNTVTLQALQANGNVTLHTLATSTVTINAPTITINALGVSITLSLAAVNGAFFATVSEKSHIVLQNYASTIRVFAGTISVSRAAGNKTPDAFVIEGKVIPPGTSGTPNTRALVTIFLEGTDLEVGRVASTITANQYDALAKLYDGAIRSTVTSTLDLRVSVYGVGVAYYIIDNSATLVSLQLGCNNSLQRDGSRYLDPTYNGCIDDTHLSGFGTSGEFHLQTQGEQLTLTVNSAGKLAVTSAVGNYRRTWSRYPFSALSATLNVSSTVNIVHKTTASTATANIYAGTSLQIKKDFANAGLLVFVRSGTVSMGVDSVVDCSPNGNKVVGTGSAITVIAACGINGAALTFVGETNLSSRSGIPNTVVLNVKGGDGNYNFTLSPAEGAATGIVNLDNATGSAATLVISSAVTATASFVLNATPSNRLLQQYISRATANINATVIAALSFAPTLLKRFRTELDSNTPLVTLTVIGNTEPGALSYAFVGSTVSSYALFTVSVGVDDAPQVILSLAAALDTETTTTLAIQAIDNSTLPATATITVKVGSQHPAQETGELTLQGVVVSNTLFVNNLYTGVIASVINIRNPGEFSGLVAGSAYTLSLLSAPSGIIISAVAGVAENRTIDININTAIATAGSYTISTELTDDHRGNGTLPLNVTLQVVNSLAIASPGGSVNEVNNINSIVATVALAANTGLAPYTYSIFTVSTASTFSNEFTSAFSTDSSGDTSATLNFRAVNGLNSDAVVTAIVRATDQLGDTADFALTLTIYTPLVAGAVPAPITIHRTYTASSFYTPNIVSGGKLPYTYTINSVQSTVGLTTNNFNIDSNSGALALSNEVATASRATVVVGVRDALGGNVAYSVIVALTDNGISFTVSNSAAQTVSIRTSASGGISTVTADWTGGESGAVSYQLGTTNPATATANFTVNASTGVLTLLNPLNSAQILSVEIIAAAAATFPGVSDVTATVEIRAITPIAFDSNTPQAATITTYATQNNLFTVTANIAVGNISYSVTVTNFSISSDNISDGIINLVNSITATGAIELEIAASEDFFGDSTTVTVSVDVIDPPALTLSASNVSSNFVINSAGKVADLALAGGFVQGDYTLYLHPTNATNNVNFAIDYTVGDTTAVLNLTNNTIAEAGTLAVTVVLDDSHPQTLPQTLAFTIALLSIFTFSADSATAVYRTELDNNIDLITLGVIGNSGDVTYSLASTTPATPAQYTLSTLGIDDTQVIISLTISSATVITSEVTSDIVIVAKDDYSALPATATITVKVGSQHPAPETGELTLQGVVVSNTLFVNNLYTGIIASVINIGNPGEFNGGLSGLSVGGSYALTQPAADAFIDIVPIVGVAENRTIDININRTTAAGSYTISTELNDNHSGNGTLSLNITLQVVNSLAIASPGGSVSEVNNIDSIVATVALAANTGLAPYTYSIFTVNFASTFSNEFTSAFSTDSSRDTSAPLNFSAVDGLNSNAVVTVIARVTDTLGDTADFALTLTIYTPLVVGAAPAPITIHRTYTASSFYTPNIVSGGKPSYTYTINSVQSADGLTTSSFNIDSNSGALSLAAEVATASRATVVVGVRDALGGNVAYSVIVALTDNGISFTVSNSAAQTVSIRTSDSGGISTVTADWTGGESGAVSYQLGATNPSTATANFTVNASTGVLTLLNPLNSAQILSVDIIAVAAATFPGVSDVTATVEIRAITPIAFDSNTPQAATITTYALQNNLFTVTANIAVGSISYSVTVTNFSISSDNISDGIINLINSITVTGAIELEIAANEDFFGDSTTVTVSVDVIDPPALTLSASNVSSNFVINSAGKVADLAIAGGFVQGDYTLYLHPTNATNNVNFAIDYTVGDSTAVLNLTNNTIADAGTLAVTVVLDDAHPQTLPQTLTFSVALLSIFTFSADSATAVYRTELDNNIDLITLDVIGNSGDVTYRLGSTTPATPAQYTLSTLGIDDTRVIISLTISSATVVTSEVTSDIIVIAEDDYSALPATATITVKVGSQHPAPETGELTLQGVVVSNTLFVNNLYTGIIASVINIGNPGEFNGGLSGLSVGGSYALTQPVADTFIDIVPVVGVAENRTIDININTAIAAGSYTISSELSDNHSGNGTLSLNITLQVVNSLAIASPGGSVSEVSNIDSIVATVALAANTGLAPYTYSIFTVSTASTFSNEFTSAFSTDSSGDTSATLNFSVVDGLNSNAVVTAIVRATDTLGDTTDFALTLTIYTPLVVGAAPAPITIHRTYTASSFYTPNIVSGGKPSYTYTINSVQSTVGLTTSSFNIDSNSGALSLAAEVATASRATVVVGVSDALGGNVAYSVIVALTDNGISFTVSNSAAQTVSIRTSDSGGISTVTANWTGGESGAVSYQLGATNPSTATANFTVNASTGVLTLLNPLNSAQILSVEIIAVAAATFPGVSDVTATVEIRAITPIAFDSNTPQAATITTYATQNNLFTVTANIAVGSISYSVTVTNFSISSDNISDGIINLINSITVTGAIELEIAASEDFFGDSTTVTVSVDVIDPPALTLLASNVSSNFVINSAGKVADLALAGGFYQSGYTLYLDGTNATNNVNFAIDYTVGDSTAVLNLTNNTIADAGTLAVTVVLDDAHPQTLPQTLTFSVALLSIFTFSADSATAVYRTELDNNIGLITLGVIGNSGDVTYSLGNTTPATPAQYTLSTLGIDDTRVIISLAIPSATVITSEVTSDIIVIAEDDYSALPATATITVKVGSQHPAQETGELTLQGVVVSNTLFVNNLYTGIIASVINIGNPGEFNGGLSGLSVGGSYALTQPVADAFIDITPVVGVAENRTIDININRTTAAGSYTISTELNDNHSGNGTLSLNITLQVVNSLAIASPGGSVSEVSNIDSIVATVALAANTGLAPYTYSIFTVSTASTFSNEFTGAFSTDSSRDTSAPLNFRAVDGLNSNAVVTVIARVTDTLGDTADFALTLTVYAPLVVGAAPAPITIHRTYTSAFYTPNIVSGGKPSYTYTINSVQSTVGLTTSSFNIDSNSGALALSNEVATASRATVVVDVSDALGGNVAYSVIVALTDNGISFTVSNSAAQTVSIRTSDSGGISTVTANWTGGESGAVSYQLGTTNPATATANFTVNASTGVLTLINPLNSAQILSVEIIAVAAATFPGVSDVTATVEVEAITPIAFDSNTPQAATITTYATQNNLFTVTANIAVGSISYSVTVTNFSISSDNISDGIINLINSITVTGAIELEIAANEDFFGDSTTVTVSVDVIDPPALTLSASNVSSNFVINSAGKVADLALAGGFYQRGYTLYLDGTNATNNVNFAIDYTVGDSTAVLNLTNNTIADAGTLAVTVVLDDAHPQTLPQTLTFSVALLSIFTFSADSATAVYRTELDNNIDLITLDVLGNLGAVTYSLGSTTPAQYTLSTLGIDDTQVIISLTISSATVITSEVTSDIVIVAKDDYSALPATATITVKVGSQHPAPETGELTLQGVVISNTLFVNNLYTGVIASVINIGNPGEFNGGLSGLSVGGSYALTQPVADTFIEITPVVGVAENRNIDININRTTAAGSYTISSELSDNHSGNGTLSLNFPLQVVNSLAIASPGGSVSEVSNIDSIVATVALAANTGLAPYTYSIFTVNFASTFSNEFTGAFSTDSSRDTSATLNFRAVDGLNSNAVVTAIARVTDQLGDTADFALTLTIYTPLVAGAAPAPITIHRTYTASAFYTPNIVSGGKPSYTYTINSVQSTVGLTTSSFNIDSNSGALSLAAEVATASRATVVVGVSDALGGNVAYSVIVALTDNGISFTVSNSAAQTVSIRTSASGGISTVTADWTGGESGAVSYQLGATNPSTATANFTVNASTGVLTLLNPLNSAQILSVEIIAVAAATFPGVSDVTATVEIRAITPIAFDSNTPQAATITTYATQNNLFTVTANIAVGSISYSVTVTNFSISSDNISDGIINLINSITVTGAIELEIAANEDFFGDSTTVTVSVDVIDPPALTLSASNVSSNFVINSAGKVADLALAGGFYQRGYTLYLDGTNATNNVNFAIDYAVGDSAAVLNLTNNTIAEAGTLAVTVVLDDAHPQTLPQTLTFSVALLSIFTFSADSATAVYRTELDNNIGLITLDVLGNLGAVTYSLDSTTPAQYTLSTLGIDDTRVIISLAIPSATVITSEVTSDIVIVAKDDYSALPTTATITVKVGSQHPAPETGELTLQGVVISNTLFVNNLYTGIIASVINIGNPGEFNGGLSGLSVGGSYALTQPAADAFIDIVPVVGVAENRTIDININTAIATAGSYTISSELSDNHSGNGTLSLNFPLQVVNSLAIASPGGSVSEVSNIDSIVATVALAANTGLAPYTYSIFTVSTASTFSNEFTGAFSTDSSGDTSATLNFSVVDGLNSNAVVTVIARVTDTLGDTADFALTLTVYAPLVVGAAPAPITIHRTYTSAFYTPNIVSGGKPSYTYTINNVQSTVGLTTSSFNIDSNSGALSLAAEVATASRATVVVGVRDALGGNVAYSVIVALTDNGISFTVSNSAAQTVSIRTSDSGGISTVTANWTGGESGAVSYQLGTTNPSTATANFTVNASTGVLTLINPLNSAQILSVEIIAVAAATFPGVSDVTATVEIRAITPIAFDSNTPQAATITTYATQNNLFTVTANIAVGSISYSVTVTNFSISSDNISDGIINLINSITVTGAIELEIAASEDFFGDSTTVTVSVDVIDPPALTLSASNVSSNFVINSAGKVADLALAGGFVQGDYTVYLHPTNTTNNVNFAIDYTVGDSAAVLNLTNNTIADAGTLAVTVVLDDAHPQTLPQTLTFSVALLSIFTFSADSATAVYRTELDNNIGLITLDVLGNLGAVTYSLGSTTPAQYTLSTLGIDDTQVIISLTISSGTTIISQVTSDIIVIAKDDYSALPATATITVKVGSQHPQTEVIAAAIPAGEYILTLGGGRYDITVNHLYTGVILSITNSNGNFGGFSGLSVGGRYSVEHTGTGVDNFEEINYLDQRNSTAELRLTNNLVDNLANNLTPARAVSILLRTYDNHSGNGDSGQITIDLHVVASLNVAPPGGANTSTDNKGAEVASITLTGGAGPYRYQVRQVNSAANLTAALTAALTINSSGAQSDRSATVSIAPLAVLAQNSTATIVIQATDELGDTAEFILTLNIYAPVIAPIEVERVTVLRTYTADNFYQPEDLISNGRMPYTYRISTVLSGSDQLTTSSFSIDSASGALSLNAEVAAAAANESATVIVEVSDTFNTAANYSVVVVFVDNALSFTKANTTITNTAITIRTSDHNSIGTLTATWTGASLGAITYQLGAITPALPANSVNFAVNEQSGALTLINTLGNVQTLSVEVIAVADAAPIVGIAYATVLVAVEAVAAISIDTSATPTAVTVATKTTRDGILTISAYFAAGAISYRVAGDERFDTTGNTVNLTVSIAAPSEIPLTIIASESLFNDSAFLTVTVHAVDGVQFTEQAPTVSLLVGASGVIYSATVISAFDSVTATIVSSTPSVAFNNLLLAANGTNGDSYDLHLINSVNIAQEISVVLKAIDEVSEDLLTVVLDINNPVGFARDNITLSMHLSDEATTIISVTGDIDYTYTQVSANISNYVTLLFADNNVVASVNSAAQLTLLTLVVEAAYTPAGSTTLTIHLEIIPDVELLLTSYTIAANASDKVGTLAASGGDGIYTYQGLAGEGGGGNNALTLVSIFADGVVSITTTLGYGVTLSLTAQVSDSIGGVGGNAEALVSIVTPLKLNFSPTTISVVAVLPNDYDSILTTISVSDGSGTYQYSLVAILPEELQLTVDAFVVDENAGVVSDNGGLSNFNVGDAGPLLQIAASDSFGDMATVFVTLSFTVQVTLGSGNSVTLLVDDSSGDVFTLTASGGSGSYNYTLISTNPVLPAANGLRYQGGVLALSSALTLTQTITAFVRADDGNNSADSEIAIIVVPTVSISAPNTLIATPNNIGYLGRADAMGGKPPYVFRLQAVTPEAYTANFTVATSGEINIKTAFATIATTTLEIVVRDGFGKEATTTVQVQVQKLVSDDSILIVGGRTSGGFHPNVNGSWISTDDTLTSWRELPENAPSKERDNVLVSHAGSIYATGGNTTGSGVVWASAHSDKGTNWEPVGNIPFVFNSESREFPNVVSSNGTLIVFGGGLTDASDNDPSGNDVYKDTWRSSDNGVTWTRDMGTAPGKDPILGHSFSGAAGSKALVFKNTLYSIGGSSTSGDAQTDIWSSPDAGETWENMSDVLANSLNYPFGMAVFGGTVYIQYRDKIQYSSDMKNWSSYDLPDDFNGRTRAEMLLYNDKLVIFPGASADDGSNPHIRDDIWESATPQDPDSWTKIATTPPWGQRYSYGAIVISGAAATVEFNLIVATPLAFAAHDNISVLVDSTVGDIATLTATGGYGGNAYSYALLATSPNAPNVLVNSNGVVSLPAAFNTAITVVASVRISEAGNTDTLDVAITIVALPPLSLTLGKVADATPNNTGVIATVSAMGSKAPYLFSLLVVKPTVVAQGGHFALAQTGEIAIQTAFTTAATATLIIEVRDGFGKKVTLAVQVQVREAENLSSGGLSGAGKILVMGGSVEGTVTLSRNDSWRSEDNTLTNWTPIDSSEHDDGVGLVAAAFGGSVYVTGRDANATYDVIWASANNSAGAVWNNVATIPSTAGGTGRYRPGLVVLNEKLLLFGGIGSNDTNSAFHDVWQSNDGSTWNQISANGFLPDSTFDGGFSSAVFKNKVYVVGGTAAGDQKVWSSADGVSWTTNPAAELPHAVGYAPAVAVYGDTFYIQYNDRIQFSSDMSNWDSYQIPAGASGFTPRRRAEMLVHDGRLVILGGENIPSNISYNDIWISEDPQNANSWTRAVASASWTNRAAFAAVVIPDESVEVIAIAPPTPLALAAGTVTVLSDRVGNITTLTATGGYDNPYTYDLLGTTPEASNVVLHNNGVVSLASAFNNSHTLTVKVSIRIGEVGNTETLDREIALVVEPTLGLLPITLKATPNSSGVIGTVAATGGNVPYVFSLQAVTPTNVAANFAMSEAGEVRIQTAFTAFATATLAIVLRDDLAQEVTATVLVLVQENLAGSGLSGLGKLVIIGGYGADVEVTNSNTATVFNARNDSWRSEDSTLTNWAELPNAGHSDNYGQVAALHKGSVYLAHNEAGGNTPIWASAINSSGNAWNVVGNVPVSGVRNFSQFFSFGGNLLFLGGSGGSGVAHRDIWRSLDDGASWTDVTPNGGGMPENRFEYAGAEFNATLYLVGGKDGAGDKFVWRSFFGRAWNMVRNGSNTSVLPENVGRGASAAVFDGTFYIQYDKKLHYSSDMINWSTTTLPSEFNSRTRAQMLVYEDQLLILGGVESNNSYNDIWASKTPQTASSWNQIVTNAPWQTRRNFAAIVIPDPEE